MITKPKKLIMGLDPGFGRLGYAIIGGAKNSPQIVNFGCLQTSPKLNQGARLVSLAKELKKLINTYKPTAVAVERLYFSKNVKTAIQVAEARGVILLTISELGYPIYEFSPQEVKLAATGHGAADKQQVQKMLKLMFRLPAPPKPDDAADALALALCALMYLP